MENPNIDGRIILRWIFMKWNVGVWTGSSWLRIRTGGGHCECGNEPSVSIKGEEFVDWLRNWLATDKRLCSMESVS